MQQNCGKLRFKNKIVTIDIVDNANSIVISICYLKEIVHDKFIDEFI